MKTKLEMSSVSRDKALALIWNHTSSDFKGTWEDGKKSLLVNGGSIRFLDTLDGEDYKDCLKEAIRRENSKNAQKIGVDIYKKHGVWPIDKGLLNQTFSTFPGMIEALTILGESNLKDIDTTSLVKEINDREKLFDPTSEVRDAMIGYLKSTYGLNRLNKHDYRFNSGANNNDVLIKIIEQELPKAEVTSAKSKLTKLTNAFERKLEQQEPVHTL